MPGTSGATGPQIADGKLHTFIIVQCITGIAGICFVFCSSTDNYIPVFEGNLIAAISMLILFLMIL